MEKTPMNEFPSHEHEEKEMDLEEVKDMVNKAMDKEESEKHENRVIVPLGMIDKATKSDDGGIDIHCENGHNYRLGNDGYLYDIGVDA